MPEKDLIIEISKQRDQMLTQDGSNNDDANGGLIEI